MIKKRIKLLFFVGFLLSLLVSCSDKMEDRKNSVSNANPDTSQNSLRTMIMLSTQQLGTSAVDAGQGVTLDSSGNVYVTGFTEGGLDGNTNAGKSDGFLVKYDSEETKQWTRQFGSADDDIAEAVVVDSAENLYVIGYTFGELEGNTHRGNIDLFLMKYNSAGIKQWTRQLGTKEFDQAYALAVDSSDHIYVTGTTGKTSKGYTGEGLDGNTKNVGSFDVFLVKYNSAGIKQWTRQFGTKRRDQAQGVAIDSNNNIYVTGFTSDGLDGNNRIGSRDIFLVKYNSAGTKQWTRQFGTSALDQAQDVAIDSNNNIYLTGFISDGLDGNSHIGNKDIFLVKYNSAGIKQWTQQWGTTTEDRAQGLAIDSNNDIYVTGFTSDGLDGNTSAGGEDIFLVKYNSVGTKQWTQQWGTAQDERGKKVDVDNLGNIYITGWTKARLDGNTHKGSADMFLMKYKSKIAPIVISTSPSRSATDVHVNSRVIATFSHAIDVATITSTTFTLTQGGVSIGGKVSYDPSTNRATFVPSASLKQKTTYTATLFREIKDRNGNTLGEQHSWKFTTSSTPSLSTFSTQTLGTYSVDEGKGITLDSLGNVYVTGFTMGGLDGNTHFGNTDMFLAKYNPGGTKQWTRQFGTSTTDIAEAVAVDSSNNLYVTGFTMGGLDGNTNAGIFDISLVKYNSSGTKQWTRQLGSSQFDNGYALAVDSSDNIYVTGRTGNGFKGYTGNGLDGNQNVGEFDIFVVKYNSSGTKQWTRQLGTYVWDFGHSIAIDSSDNLYITGWTTGKFNESTNTGGAFLVKYDSGGTKQWIQQWGTNKTERGYAIAVDSSDHLYITGHTFGELEGNTHAGKNDLFLAKYNSSGAKQWVRQWGTNEDEFGYGIAVDSSDHPYITGWTTGKLDGNTNAGGADVFLVKYNSSGARQWTRQWGTNRYDQGKAVDIDSSGNVYVTGWTSGGLHGNMNKGNKDVFVVKYDSSGNRK